MPNWDGDGPDFDDDFDKHTPRTYTHTRGRVLNVPERQVRNMWNGNPVKSMESDHIMNAILFCEKKWAEAVRNHSECFDGPSFDEQKERFYFKDVYDMFPEYVNLRDEWKRRKEL